MDTPNSPFEALNRIVEIAGSQSEAARRLAVPQPTFWKWLQSSKRLPAEYVLLAEREFGVSRHDLRPDIYPRNYPPAPDQTERWIGIDKGADRRVA
ncbi:transcriptional regulator [Sphingopyxis sp. NFH-91]|uniref:transcriptional regulator n=1 Tax=Sphingopyxis sp. NFH-91 TaxID=2744457 RepID=UPI001F274E1F|nr:YdaS family helix-turn-helix protein [Sphingopyxis sp. NFH-91]